LEEEVTIMKTGENQPKPEPECFGKRRCPSATDNRGRWLCPTFLGCLNEFILRQLRKGKYPHQIRKELVFDVWKDVSDYIALIRIAKVAKKNGFSFGRNKIKRAIRESRLDEDADPNLERREIRRAFDLYGTKVASPSENEERLSKKGSIGPSKLDVDAVSHNGPSDPTYSISTRLKTVIRPILDRFSTRR
jgi:hypothetical protein